VETQRSLLKYVYADGQTDRALKGYPVGESPDGLFFIVERPLGDRVWVAKSAVRSISPVPSDGRL